MRPDGVAFKLYLIVDPMCSWCWGFSAVWREFSRGLPRDVEVVDLMGGLAPDSTVPMDASTREYVQSAWRSVAETTGATFNFDFWRTCEPRRSTYPACRAVIAAGLQTLDARRAMYDAIQNAYFLDARNPSLSEELISISGEIGLDSTLFADDLGSNEVASRFAAERQACRNFGVTGFPTLIWSWQSADDEDASPRYGLLAAGYTNLDTLLSRWHSLTN